MENITADLEKNKQYLAELFQDCSDVVMRGFSCGGFFKRSCLLIYIDGLCDKKFISENVVEKLMSIGGNISAKRYIRELNESVISASETLFENTFDALEGAVTFGDCVLLVDGCSEYIIISAKSPAKRAISEPASKKAIRGPRDGFNENLRDNTSLIRSKIQSPALKMIAKTAGDDTNTHMAVCYLEGTADEAVIARVMESLDSIKLKSVLASGYLQNSIEMNAPSFFPQIEATERPDEACSALLQGRVVVAVDNTPFVILLPGIFKCMVSATEDYYESNYKRHFILALRIFAMIFTVLLPAMYIAVVDYNPEFVSEKIIMFITVSRRQVPFAAFAEILLVELVFEIILEAGIRLPSQLAFSVGIVGTIVLGQALVDANLVNMTVIIIVALTAILVFVIPNYSLALSVRFLKFIFMFAAYISGFFGIFVAFVVTLISLCDVNTYGVEFMTPYVDSDITLKNVRKVEK